MLTWICLFILSLTVLVKASDWFTQYAEIIGKNIGVPPFIVGVTIVALGTSLPELISSVVAVNLGASEIVVGNVIGSNITNIFLIFGFTALFSKHIQLKYDLSIVDLPLLIGSTLLFVLMIRDGDFSLFEAVLCLMGLTVYFAYTVKAGSNKTDETSRRKGANMIRPWIVLALSGVGVYGGARFTVDAIIRLSETFSIGREIIAASAVALGTSLPELMVSVSSAKRGNAEMAVGNILGSNIFNTFGVTGIAALFGKLRIPDTMLRDGLPILLVATFLFLFITQERRVTRWEGALMFIFYLFYLSQLFLN